MMMLWWISHEWLHMFDLFRLRHTTCCELVSDEATDFLLSLRPMPHLCDENQKSNRFEYKLLPKLLTQIEK
jgi:hypothetical protein